jgi:MoaA/NifB/PqqE/SkfB family radical SAM enzyme
MTIPTTPDFDALLDARALPPLRRARVATLQVNVGKRCDLACHHCHVEAGPKRTEMMDTRTAERVIELLAAHPGIGTLDLTGGAPELNPNFRALVGGARALGREVIDRCNLTVLFEPGQEGTARFLAEQGVKVVASLPAQPGSGLVLDLVYNPLGASLPPPQAELEATYHTELDELFGITFDRLVTITNMPIKRFAHALARDGRHADYMGLLVDHFNPATLSELMCRSLVSVAWDGTIYDCDFNQMLEMPLGAGPRSIWEIASFDEIEGRAVGTASHCFGCTAGNGSSCGGALA